VHLGSFVTVRRAAEKEPMGVDANFAPHPTRRRPASLTELAVTLQQGMQFLIDDYACVLWHNVVLETRDHMIFHFPFCTNLLEISVSTYEKW
jgi:hypothetical protein